MYVWCYSKMGNSLEMHPKRQLVVGVGQPLAGLSTHVCEVIRDTCKAQRALQKT